MGSFWRWGAGVLGGYSELGQALDAPLDCDWNLGSVARVGAAEHAKRWAAATSAERVGRAERVAGVGGRAMLLVISAVFGLRNGWKIRAERHPRSGTAP
jgi:hypothetical protein